MKIVDLEVIPFTVPRRPFANGQLGPERTVTQTVTRISTDDGVCGHYFGGHGHGDHDGLGVDDTKLLLRRVRDLLLGQDPFDRERIWHWLWVANLPENIISVVDLALWDLQGNAVGLPVHKLLGGCRERVKAYASTFPNMGPPELYAEHALQCRESGFRAYKIHPYYFWDPETGQPDPGRPSHIDWDIRACQLVREAVGPDMVLMYDPWGTYRTFEDAVRVGRQLEELDFKWFEHPMPEYRVESYVRLCRELSIPILAPEIAAGSIYTRADWCLRGASDMTRIDVLRGGITGCHKMAAIAEAFGIKCEIHMSGFGNLQVLGATSEDVCEYYEHGLDAPGVDTLTPPPYLEEVCDAVAGDGTVAIPTAPGLGYRVVWDYIEEHRRQGIA